MLLVVVRSRSARVCRERSRDCLASRDSGAEKFALFQSQLITWALVLVVAYLPATKVSAVLGLAYLAVMIAVFAYSLFRVVRDTREP